MVLDNLSKALLKEIAGLHDLSGGAFSFRKNGKSLVNSTKNIVIEKKKDKPGINIFVSAKCDNEVCHIPVVVTDGGLFDVVYNDFYIEEGAKVTIVAGCGVHSSDDSGHNGIHSLYVGKNAVVEYIENHIATGKASRQELNPVTNIFLESGANFTMKTTQLGGVTYSNRDTKAVLKENSILTVNEKVLTSRFDIAKTKFKVNLKGSNSKCVIVSRSVAKDESEQIFKSDLVGNSKCFGRVECDGILLNNSIIISEPKVSCKNKDAELSHEAAIGKIAGEQLIKLMTMGLTEQQAENKIIEGFLK